MDINEIKDAKLKHKVSTQVKSVLPTKERNWFFNIKEIAEEKKQTKK